MSFDKNEKTDLLLALRTDEKTQNAFLNNGSSGEKVLYGMVVYFGCAEQKTTAELEVLAKDIVNTLGYTTIPRNIKAVIANIELADKQSQKSHGPLLARKIDGSFYCTDLLLETVMEIRKKMLAN